MNILGIESSCDEMAAAVLRGREVVSSVVHDQTRVHQPYGGIVPELASRDHVCAISNVVRRALEAASLREHDLNGIAVTAGPGLMGSLLVGVSFGKALAYRLGIPIVGVHHLSGHLAAAELADASLRPPYIGLVVSGGHTALYRIASDSRSTLLGETRDDAVGEAFDKVAKLLGLPYPGGPAIAQAAQSGDPEAIAFPRPLVGKGGLDFSYSGLKTAVAVEMEARGGLAAISVPDFAASFEAAATEVLVQRAAKAVQREGLDCVAIVGGVAANRRLRETMQRMATQKGFRAVFPPLELCTDNAAMIAAAGARLIENGESHGASLAAFSRVPFGDAPWRAE